MTIIDKLLFIFVSIDTNIINEIKEKNLLLENIYYISAIVALLVSIIMITIAYKQLRKITLQLNFSTLLRVYDEMGELRPFWHKLYTNYRSNKDCNTWTKEEIKIADKVCTDLERIAYLCEHKFIDEKLLMLQYSDVYAKTWFCLHEYVMMYRKNYGEPETLKEGGYQRCNYERFAIKATKYCKKHNIPYAINVFSNNIIKKKKKRNEKK